MVQYGSAWYSVWWLVEFLVQASAEGGEKHTVVPSVMARILAPNPTMCVRARVAVRTDGYFHSSCAGWLTEFSGAQFWWGLWGGWRLDDPLPLVTALTTFSPTAFRGPKCLVLTVFLGGGGLRPPSTPPGRGNWRD